MLNTLFVIKPRNTRPPQKRKFYCDTPALMPDLSEYMTTEQVAKELGFTVKSVRNMIYRNSLPCERFGRSLLVPKKAVFEYLEKTKGLPKNSPLRKIK